MITAWQIYWVLQLDGILSVARIVSVFGTVFGGIGYVFYRFLMICDDEDGKNFASFMAISKPVFLIGMLCLALNAFLPSSKTVAAMILVPAITNEKVIKAVTPEARELYDLAKDALRNLGTKDAAEKEPAK